MPYPQDLEGKFIEYKLDPGGADPGLVGKVKEDAIRSFRVAVYKSTAAKTKTPPPRAADLFENTNLPWNFTFLKYYAGAVTTAPLGTALVTGPMSGCFLFTFTHGGKQKLAHVGTASTRDCHESVEVKKAWVELLKSATGEVMGVSPFDYFSPGDYSAAMFPNGGIPQVVANFVGGPAYAMLLAPVPDGMTPPNVSLMKVAKVKPMTLHPWATIAKSPKFSHSRTV